MDAIVDMTAQWTALGDERFGKGGRKTKDLTSDPNKIVMLPGYLVN